MVAYGKEKREAQAMRDQTVRIPKEYGLFICEA